MLSLANDYSVGAHPQVLDYLVATNNEVVSGYCNDKFCEEAAVLIRKACDCPKADVYFYTGGTQANMATIAALLGENEGVICADSGHINAHEAGAVEATGHKIISLQGKDGKLFADTVKEYLKNFNEDPSNCQMVLPKVVFISQPTEFGTVYSKKELTELYSVCKKNKMKLYIDGARLGYALASKVADFDLKDIASLCDAFYIGGTKCGALCGEALVFPKGDAPERFASKMKSRGALMAKGRLLGTQYIALMKGNLYTKICANADKKAIKLVKILQESNIRLYSPLETNQIFVVLTNEMAKKLEKSLIYTFWSRLDDNNIIARFVTSWATTDEDVKEFERIIRTL